MNLSGLLDAALSLASLALAGAVPIVLPRLLALMHIQVTAQQEVSLENTLTSAVGAALSYGKTAGDPLLANVQIRNSALSAAAAFAADDAPVAMAALGYTPQSLAEVIDARISHALAGKQPAPPPAPPAAPVSGTKIAA